MVDVVVVYRILKGSGVVEWWFGLSGRNENEDKG